MIKIENAAVLRKDEIGKLHIKETYDMGGGKGAALGGVGGAAIGLIAGAALAAPVVVGALVGGLVAKLRDSGFSDERLKAVGEGLTPGSSAIIAVVEHKWIAQLEEALAETEADLLTLELQADIAEQLEAGHDVAYSASRHKRVLLLGEWPLVKMRSMAAIWFLRWPIDTAAVVSLSHRKLPPSINPVPWIVCNIGMPILARVRMTDFYGFSAKMIFPQ